MKHWKCGKCHHEWDGDQVACDWCGAAGRALEDKPPYWDAILELERRNGGPAKFWAKFLG